MKNENFPAKHTATTSAPQEVHEIKQNRRSFIANSVLGGLAVAGIGIGVYDMRNEALHGKVFEGEINPSITGIELLDGARLRSGPFAPIYSPFNNMLTSISIESENADSQSVVIPTPSGAFENFTLPSGEWYGMRTIDLLTFYLNDINNTIKMDTSKILDDTDRIIWINYQKATPVKGFEEVEVE